MERPDDGDTIEVLCDAITRRYHASLHASLKSIRAEIEAMVAAHPSPQLHTLQSAFAELSDQIESHLAKEENLLFPALHALAGAHRTGGARPAMAFATVLYPIRLLEAEHLRIGAALDHLRELALVLGQTDRLPRGWRRCLAELSRLDDDLRAHHQTEHEILFPQALDLERRLV